MSFKEECEAMVARDLTKDESTDLRDWVERTMHAKTRAQEKINSMNNLELLELIGKVLYERTLR